MAIHFVRECVWIYQNSRDDRFNAFNFLAWWDSVNWSMNLDYYIYWLVWPPVSLHSSPSSVFSFVLPNYISFTSCVIRCSEYPCADSIYRHYHFILFRSISLCHRCLYELRAWKPPLSELVTWLQISQSRSTLKNTSSVLLLPRADAIEMRTSDVQPSKC
jgi:hypothetical protein